MDYSTRNRDVAKELKRGREQQCFRVDPLTIERTCVPFAGCDYEILSLKSALHCLQPCISYPDLIGKEKEDS